jgi:hypothetical protein
LKLKKIIISWSLFYAVLILAAVFSYAWVSENRAVEHINPPINLENDDTTASYGVYKYDPKLGMGRNTDINGNPYSITDIDINPYDLIFLSRNRYTPVFARVEVKRNTSMPKSGTVYLTITRKLDNNDSKGSELSKFSSSLIRFTAKVDQFYDENPDALYRHIDTAMYNDTKNYRIKANDTSHDYDVFSKTFVTAEMSENGYTFKKVESITLEMKYNESDWSDETEILNIYLYMTYDEGLIDLYKSTSDFKIEVGTKNIIDFKNDFDTIKVSYKGGQ